MFNLNNKIAIVTGAASGIGLATAEAFVSKGAKVILSDYNIEAGKLAEKRLVEQGADVLFIGADVSKEEDIKILIEETCKKYKRLDIMVNNAGIGFLASSHELSYADYRRVIEINQDGVFFGSKYAIIEMLKNGGGVVVNVSSILGFCGQARALAYNASKGAVNIMTKSLALEYADKGIRVNSVNPGYVETGMVNKEALGDYYDGLVAQHPIGRLGNADEIAHGIVFLCENEFTTGSNLIIDGGYLAK